MMTVGELIEELKKHDANKLVLLNAPRALAYIDAARVKTIPYYPNAVIIYGKLLG